MSESDTKYDYTKDKSMRTWGTNILAFIFIFAVSAKLTEQIINKYFYKDTSHKL
jgi:hypothetical protein